ncbi:MAG: AbgT family transporter [Prevotella sp.]|nr:AbgT family transporter [Prevotella sp.]
MNRFFPITTLVLVIAQLLLILLSWIFTAAMPELAINSLISNEGIRWFFGHFTSNLLSPFLIWIILLSITYGIVRRSGILSIIFRRKQSKLHYRQKFALRIAGIEFIGLVAMVLFLTAGPNAPLLSATGELFPSSFSHSIVPILAFGLMALSITYGVFSKEYKTLGEVFDAMTKGLTCAVPYIVLYIFAFELYHSVVFVFKLT